MEATQLAKLESLYTQRDLTMILLGAKITAEVLASEYDDDKICQTVLSDLINLSDSKDYDYSCKALLEVMNKNLYQ